MKTLYIACFILLSLAYVPVQAAEVLVVKWFGMRPYDVVFQEKLKELHPGVKFHLIDAQSSKTRLATQIRSFDLSKIDLVYSVGTTATKLTKSFVNGKIPQVFNLVSAPVLSRITKSINKPGDNITGAKYLLDFETQIDIITKLKPVETLAVWFDPREKQAETTLIHLQKAAEKKGITLKTFRIIPEAGLEKMIARAAPDTNDSDALYIVATASYYNKSHVIKKIVSSLDPKLMKVGTVSLHMKKGTTIVIGPDPNERALKVADMAARILRGENAGEIPVSLVTAPDTNVFINQDIIREVGLKDIDKLGLNIKIVELEK